MTATKKIEKVNIGPLTAKVDLKRAQQNLLENFNLLSALLNENEDCIDQCLRHHLETRMRHLQNTIAIFISLDCGVSSIENKRLLPCEFLET